jgi:DNA (cytosine-5)-methyltransferase 1
MDTSVSAIDLFCGAGGMTHGLELAGVRVRAGFDTDSSCRYPYEANNNAEFVQGDVRWLTPSALGDRYPHGGLRLLVGCAPCQPFSIHTQKNRRRDRSLDWGLLYSFLRLVGSVMPDLVSMENVPQLMKQGVFQDFKRGLMNCGYFVRETVVYCPDYGIPQVRRRLVLLASRMGPIHIGAPTHSRADYVTVRQTIGRLAAISAGEGHAGDRLHCAASLSQTNLERIRASRAGGTWRDWNEELQLECHRRQSGKSYGGTYGRMDWDIPSPTITTQFFTLGTGRFGHPEQNRALSLREGALLQTFPLTYRFVRPDEKLNLTTVGRLIGNAVPVKLGEVVGASILAHVKERGYG